MTDNIRARRRRRPSVLPLLEDDSSSTNRTEPPSTTSTNLRRSDSSSVETSSNPRLRTRRTASEPSSLLDGKLDNAIADPNSNFILQRAQISSPPLINTIDQISTELDEDRRDNTDSEYWDDTHDWGSEYKARLLELPRTLRIKFTLDPSTFSSILDPLSWQLWHYSRFPLLPLPWSCYKQLNTANKMLLCKTHTVNNC